MNKIILIESNQDNNQNGYYNIEQLEEENSFINIKDNTKEILKDEDEMNVENGIFGDIESNQGQPEATEVKSEICHSTKSLLKESYKNENYSLNENEQKEDNIKENSNQNEKENQNNVNENKKEENTFNENNENEKKEDNIKDNLIKNEKENQNNGVENKEENKFNEKSNEILDIKIKKEENIIENENIGNAKEILNLEENTEVNIVVNNNKYNIKFKVFKIGRAHV